VRGASSLRHFAGGLLLGIALFLPVSLMFARCASLPPSTIPVCSDDPGVVCRAPTPDWAISRLCQSEIDLQYRACYLHAGHRDGRDLYVYVRFR
jgi:hypothetical protein